eukprot:2807025-Pleurochrysis_carterae.AAC.1
MKRRPGQRDNESSTLGECGNDGQKAEVAPRTMLMCTLCEWESPRARTFRDTTESIHPHLPKGTWPDEPEKLGLRRVCHAARVAQHPRAQIKVEFGSKGSRSDAQDGRQVVDVDSHAWKRVSTHAGAGGCPCICGTVPKLWRGGEGEAGVGTDVEQRRMFDAVDVAPVQRHANHSSPQRILRAKQAWAANNQKEGKATFGKRRFAF